MSHEQSNEIGDLAKALSAAQAELEGAKKTSVNPHFRTKYADLSACWEAIRETLPSHGLSVVQTLGFADGRTIVTTQLMHSSGQWVRGSCPIKPVKDDPQGMGSAITYGRRYGLAAIVGLTQDDDDGQAASSGGRERREQPRKERRAGGERDQRPARTDIRRPTPAAGERPKTDEPGPWDDTKIDSRTPWAIPAWYGMTLGECADWQDAAVKQAPVEVARELPEPSKSFARRAHKLLKKRTKEKAA